MLGELQKRDSVNQYNFFSKYCIKKKDIEFNIVSNGDKIIYIQGSVNSLWLNSWQPRRKLKEALIILHPHNLWFSRRPVYKVMLLVWRMTTPSKACFLTLSRKYPVLSFWNNKDVSHLQLVIPTGVRIKMISPILQTGHGSADKA